MITLLLSIVFLVLQAFGINVIQDWDAMYLAAILELPVELFIGVTIAFIRLTK